MNFERETEGFRTAEGDVISSDSEKSRSNALRRDLASLSTTWFSLPLEMTNRIFMQ
jgi:hypothetical protein